MLTKTKIFFSFRGLWLLGIFLLSGFLFSAFAQESESSPPEPLTSASIGGFPYTKIFDITGYYSPLPGQNKYATGNYDAEIRLNGRGTNGASGREVFPGMIAAPSVYPFGTKMYIPGIGTTGVYDRGGAIVAATSDAGQDRNLRHDRLDVWMGFGDAGLSRALGWGRRTVNVTVYGLDNSLQESVYLEGYSAAETVVRQTFFQPTILTEDVWYLSSGDDVYTLQKLLKELGYFSGQPNGFYGDETRDSVFRFQKDQSLVTSMDDLGAGHGGPQTRIRLEKFFKERRVHNLPQEGLSKGSSGDEVKKLQNILSMLGYDVTETGFFDDKTLAALLDFQKDQDIIQSPVSFGAGYFGPKTSDYLERQYVAAISKTDDDAIVDVPQYLVRDLKIGDNGPAVTRLQEELQRMNFLRIIPTGHFGEVTQHAVFKFQQSMELVFEKESPYAGIFGPVTRSKMNGFVASRHYVKQLLASKKMEQAALLAHAPLIPEGLSFGARGEDVTRLQNFLKNVGFLPADDEIGFFGEKTRDGLIAFQKTQRIISSEFDVGAGRVGPQTKSVIEKFLSTTRSNA